MTPVVKVRDVVSEMEMQSDEISAYLNKRTGEITGATSDAFAAAEKGEEDDLNKHPHQWERDMILQAKEILDSDDYIELPDKYEINEYDIMEEFCNSVKSSGIREDLLERIRGRGAFRCFKDAVRRHGIEEKWYRYRDAELEKIAIEWLDSNGIPYTKDIEAT